MTYETHYDGRTGRLAEPTAGWETTIADARRELDEAYEVGLGGAPATAEHHAIEAARDAARDGFCGAYPLPPVGGVDDWWRSGPRFAIGRPADQHHDGDENELTEGANAPPERWGFATAEGAQQHAALDDDGDGWF